MTTNVDMKVLTQVRQMAIRLESDSTTSERLEALEQLQGMSRVHPQIVCDVALTKAFEILQDGRSAEESQEALELIHQLVGHRDRQAALSSAAAVFSERNNVELLLYLLEHEDLTVGVQTSQILTELHATDGIKLEKMIQDCPEGMTKLLQRLPDSSREAVRNQALVLVQQLTRSNEEMKKTLVFNEGFEVLFGIIQSEYSLTQDTNIVVQDCLHICCNLLVGSETCQRLFFGMGNEWSLRLAYFFDPVLLENPPWDGDLSIDASPRTQAAETPPYMWYEKPGSVACAAIALSALANALTPANINHQRLLGVSLAGLIPAAAFSIARQGPAEMVGGALALLARMAAANPEVAMQVSSSLLRLHPAVRGTNIPESALTPSLLFGWRPLPGDERTCITVPALLSERYIFGGDLWIADPTSVALSDREQFFQLGASEGLAAVCLQVMDQLLAANSGMCDLFIQHVLAPPLPLPEEDDNPDAVNAIELESSRPLATLLFNVLVGAINRSLLSADHANVHTADGLPDRYSLSAASRAANVICLIFLHGGLLAKELAAAVSVGHTMVPEMDPAATKHHPASSLPLLPYLLSVAGKVYRVPVVGPQLLISVLHLLTTVAAGCEPASRLLLQDPSNLYVLDLASTSSDTAGVPAAVQVSVCLFLGTCFAALSGVEVPSSDPLTRGTLLSMIDARITLTRFTELLRRPLVTYAMNAQGVSISEHIFFAASFRPFYEAQVDAILKAIYACYSGNLVAATHTTVVPAESPVSAPVLQDPTDDPSLLSSPALAAISLSIDTRTPDSSTSSAPPTSRLRTDTEAYATLSAAEEYLSQLEAEKTALAAQVDDLLQQQGHMAEHLQAWIDAVAMRDARIIELGQVEASYIALLDAVQLRGGLDNMAASMAGDREGGLDDSRSNINISHGGRTGLDASMYAALSEKLGDAERLNVQLTEKGKGLENSVADLEEVNAHLSQQVRDLEDSLTTANAHIADSDRLRQRLEQEIINIKEAQRAAAISVPLTTLESIDGKRVHDLQAEQALRYTEHAQQIAVLETSLRETQQGLHSSEAALRQKEAIVSSLEYELIDARSLNEETESLREESAALRLQLDHANQQAIAAAAELLESKKQLQEMKEATAAAAAVKRPVVSAAPLAVAVKAPPTQSLFGGPVGAPAVKRVPGPFDTPPDRSKPSLELNETASFFSATSTGIAASIFTSPPAAVFADDRTAGSAGSCDETNSMNVALQERIASMEQEHSIALAQLQSSQSELLSTRESLGCSEEARRSTEQRLQDLTAELEELRHQAEKHASVESASQTQLQVGLFDDRSDGSHVQGEALSPIVSPSTPARTVPINYSNHHTNPNTAIPATPDTGPRLPQDLSRTMTPGSRTTSALGLLSAMSPQQKELGRLNSEVLKERRRLSQLQEQHNDLLALLAQQSIELVVFRTQLDAKAGQAAVSAAEQEASIMCIERYGTYISCKEEEGDVTMTSMGM